MSHKGLLIALEGIEGSGKSTQATQLLSRLEEHGKEIMLTREPGGTGIGEKIRGILQGSPGDDDICSEAELLLFAASRSQLVREKIAPALERGVIVILDRFFDSTTAYQGAARGLDPEDVMRINRFAIGGYVPDLTLLLDLDVTDGLSRIQERHRDEGTSNDRIENEQLPFHERVRQGYLALAEKETGRFHIVDASMDIAAVGEEIWQIVQPRLP